MYLLTFESIYFIHEGRDEQPERERERESEMKSGKNKRRKCVGIESPSFHIYPHTQWQLHLGRYTHTVPFLNSAKHSSFSKPSFFLSFVPPCLPPARITSQSQSPLRQVAPSFHLANVNLFLIPPFSAMSSAISNSLETCQCLMMYVPCC